VRAASSSLPIGKLCELSSFPVADENDAVLREMAVEVQTVRVAALHFHLLPMVGAALRSGGVPARPSFRQLFRPSPLIAVRDLSEALTYVDEHSEYFDAATKRLVDEAHERLRLREVVNGGSATLIAQCVQQECTLLPSADSDRVNAAKFVRLESEFSALMVALRDGRPGGEPGALLWNSLSPEPLEKALVSAEAIEAAEGDESWRCCLSVARFVLDVRTLLQHEIPQENADFRLSLEKIEAFARATASASAHADVAGVEICLQAAAEEMSVFRRQIIHSRAIADLLRAAARTQVSGQVGSLDFSAVDEVDIARQLADSWKSGSLVQNAQSLRLAEEITALLGLRRRAMQLDCDWAALALEIQQLGQGIQQPELALLLNECCDVRCDAIEL
jgi:hypothetical protein